MRKKKGNNEKNALFLSKFQRRKKGWKLHAQKGRNIIWWGRISIMVFRIFSERKFEIFISYQVKKMLASLGSWNMRRKGGKNRSIGWLVMVANKIRVDVIPSKNSQKGEVLNHWIWDTRFFLTLYPINIGIIPKFDPRQIDETKVVLSILLEVLSNSLWKFITFLIMFETSSRREPPGKFSTFLMFFPHFFC